MKARRTAEGGFSILEALVAVALLAICTGGVLAAAASIGRFAAAPAGPNRAAALAAAEETARIAQDAWKYGAPASPVPNGTWSTTSRGVPLNIGASTTSAGDLVVTVAYPPDSSRGESGTVTLHTTLRAIAPRPREKVVRPGLVPAPSGAP